MFKVLIVDDEPIIREGLKTIINWEECGFYICGDAVNGKDGIFKITELRPDLIIVDIRMPGMDGLQMIEELNNNGIRCKIIILTGYSDFKYAKRAVDFGVEAYVLKPIDKEELSDKVRKAFDSISNERKIMEALNESVTVSKERIIEHLVSGQADLKLINKRMELYKLDINWRSFQVILIELNIKEDIDINLKLSIKREIEACLCNGNNGYIFNINGYIGALLKNSPFAVNITPLTILQNKIKWLADVEVTISVGKVVENINDIYLSFSHAQMLMSKKFIYGKGSIISDDKDGIKTSKEGEDVDIKKALGELYTSVYISNKEEIDRLLGEIALRLASGDSSEDIIKLNYFNIYFAIVNKLNMEEHNMGENLQINETVISDFMEIYKKTSLNELHDYIKCKLISLTEEVSKKRPDCTMKKIIDYINKNYNGDVKLETLAQMFNYNSAYLGKLFKSHTGEYFNTYLDMVRIENAKQMLEDGLKVYQVAERIGYYNINYFISKFKKYVGDSPSSYKKRCK